MLILGDVLGVLAIVLGICASSWAILLAFAALFPARAEQSRTVVESHPWRSMALGLVGWTILGTFGLVLIQSPNGLAKIIGMVLLVVPSAITAVGSAGIAHLMADRFRKMDETLSEYTAFTRASFAVVVAGILPIVGWFAVVPAVMAVGFGAGLSAVLSRIPSSPAIDDRAFQTGA